MKSRFWIAPIAALMATATVTAPVAAQTAPRSDATASYTPASYTPASYTSAADAVRGNPARWTSAAAKRWYDGQPWLVGANYTPATAINQLEMWQAATWDPRRIDLELGWAKKFGMNTMRVYLHDLAYSQDPAGMKRRLDAFLTIAARHGIKPMLVLFDSCWDPDPVIGPQHRPIPGVHNSGWVQGPSRADLVNPANDARLRTYVEDIVGSFAKDRRVLAWDIWNEPDNGGGGSYNGAQLAQEQTRIAELLPQAFEWARSRKPVQPLTSGVWIGDNWTPGSPSLNAIQRIQLAESDVITFHNYDWPEQFSARIAQLRPYGRPLICTEWMARGNGSTVDTVLPIARAENVGMINWGYVQGDTQTHFPWDSWERPYTLQQPTIWFHDLMRPDGTPYREREAETFRRIAAQNGRAAAR